MSASPPRLSRVYLKILISVLFLIADTAVAQYEGGDGDLGDLITGTGFSLEPATPTPTATATSTATATFTPSPTSTVTPTATHSPTPILIATFTATPAETTTFTPTPTHTAVPVTSPTVASPTIPLPTVPVVVTPTPVVERTETPHVTPGVPTPPTDIVLEFLDESGTPFANYLVHILGVGSFLTDDSGRIFVTEQPQEVKILLGEQAFTLPSLNKGTKIVAERREDVEACYDEQRMNAHLAMDTAWYELVEYSIGILKDLKNTAHERQAIAEVNIRTQRLSAGLLSQCVSQRVQFQALRRQSLRVYRYFFRAIRNRGNRTILRERRADARSRRRGYLLQRGFLTELKNFAVTGRGAQ